MTNIFRKHFNYLGINNESLVRIFIIIYVLILLIGILIWIFAVSDLINNYNNFEVWEAILSLFFPMIVLITLTFISIIIKTITWIINELKH
jgi:hypothetical protein